MPFCVRKCIVWWNPVSSSTGKILGPKVGFYVDPDTKMDSRCVWVWNMGSVKMTDQEIDDMIKQARRFDASRNFKYDDFLTQMASK